jgi:glycosyltransferase involved in cell wall biosynthesis
MRERTCIIAPEAVQSGVANPVTATRHGGNSLLNRPSSQRQTASTANDRAAIGILMSEALRSYDDVRKRPFDFLDRLQEAMLKRAMPSFQTGVRGNVVAADILLEAIIQYGSTPLDIFVHPECEKDATEHLQSAFDRATLEKIRIVPIDGLVTGAIDRGLRAWFTPLQASQLLGGMEISQRIRASRSSHMYPITLLIHGLGIHRMVWDPFLRMLLGGTYPCDSLICTSRACRDAVVNLFEFAAEEFGRDYGVHLRYEGRLDLIPLGIDTERLRPRDKRDARRILKLPKDAFILLFLGRISSFKADLYPFVQVFEALLRQNPNRQLMWIIAGSDDKDYTKRLLEYCRPLGIHDKIKVILNVSDELKEQLLPAADVFVSPVDTLQESFGLSPIEAMACGVPQVVPDWSGYRDTVTHGDTGFLVPTYWTECHRDLQDSGTVLWAYDLLSVSQSVAIDLKKYTEFIQALIDNEQLRSQMARRSRERAVQLYSLKAVVIQYEQLWDELSEMARRLPVCRNTPNFDRPRYYDLYGHYSSHALSDETLLRLTAVGNKMAADGTYLPLEPGTLSTFKILNEEVLRQALQIIARYGEPLNQENAAIRMGSLTETLTKQLTCHPDQVRRYIMWLIKYGCLTPMMESNA